MNENRYVMTSGRLKRRNSSGLPTKCHASFCNEEIKVGDRVVTKQVGYRGKTNIWHEECFDKVMEMAI